MPRSASSANSRGVALLSATLVATACTSMLGIDGNYYAENTSSGGSTSSAKGNATGGKTIVPQKSGGTSGVINHDAGSTASGEVIGGGGTPASGGSVQDASLGGHTNAGGTETSGAGGTSSGGSESGGTSAAGAAGAGEAGGNPPGSGDAGVCPVGTFMGTYSGIDHPSSGGTALAAKINGSITLRFSATSSGGRTITGGVAYLLTADSGGFAGTFIGSFDCETETGSVTLIDPSNITTVAPPLVAVPVDGTFKIQPGTNGALKGSFSIHESLNATATGVGTWATN